jgi:hypothetical protein
MPSALRIESLPRHGDRRSVDFYESTDYESHTIVVVGGAAGEVGGGIIILLITAGWLAYWWFKLDGTVCPHCGYDSGVAQATAALCQRCGKNRRRRSGKGIR